VLADEHPHRDRADAVPLDGTSFGPRPRDLASMPSMSGTLGP